MAARALSTAFLARGSLRVFRSFLTAGAASLAAGSCLIFDDRILHRGLGNTSNSRRSMVYFSYRQAGYSENTHFEAQRSVHDARS